MNKPKGHKKLGLEMLRFALALSVVFYHYFYFGPLDDHVSHSLFFWDGFLIGRFAVPTFFIISGYVIFFSAQQNSWRNFSASRFSRLFPALLTCATLTYLVLLAAAPDIAQDKTQSFVEAITFLPLFVFHGLIDESYWSIVYEVRFYALVALLLFFGLFRHLSRVMAGASLLGLALSLIFEDGTASGYVLFPYVSFFGLGIVLAEVEREGLTRSNILLGLWHVALASYGFRYALNNVDLFAAQTFPFWVSLLMVITAVLVVRVCAGMNLSPRASKIAVPLGAISYPLYLLHQEAGYAAINTLGPVLGARSSATLMIGVMLAAAWGVHILVERRLCAPLRAKLSSAR